MKWILIVLILILTYSNDVWIWLDLSKVSSTYLEESNGPTWGPKSKAKLTIFKVSENRKTYLSAMKLILTVLILIITYSNAVWHWLDLSKVSSTSPEESDGPTLGPIWAKLMIFRASKKKKTYLSAMKLIQTLLFLILTNTNDVWLWLDLSKVSSTSTNE